METLGETEAENKKDFKKLIYIGGGVVLIAVIITVFLLVKKERPKAEEAIPIAPLEEKALFSLDVSTWENYFWPEKVNTKYPSDFELKETLGEGGEVEGLEIVPPTGDSKDTIFVGGESVTCPNIAKYPKNKCLQNKIRVPFYTESANEEVLSAFDLIVQNSILLEETK